ncbi:MAG: dipeptidase [Gemmatimonadales bacterium]|nr:MAG: dipeptidase [Gemmatimonadales bacterium]
MNDLRATLTVELDRLRDELFELLRIPSVSARSEHASDTRAAAEWVRDHMQRSGLEAEILETGGHPVALGSWHGAGPDAPTLLIYGHYDVQPPEPLELWSSPPFDPEIRDGRIYARGAADDKGQLFLHLAALDVILRTRGSLPVNVVVLAEGEEEIGSPNLLTFVQKYRERLGADAVVISDSAMFAPGQPSLLFSLRGLAYAEIRIRGSRSDLHSGAYGGAVPNAATELTRILSTLHDADGRVTIPGFYDAVVEWDTETRDGIAALPFSDEEFREGVGATHLAGESGYSTLERLWVRPTCEVNGLLSGYTGEGAKTVLPAEAMAKVSCRLVPDQDPDRTIELLRSHVAAVASPSVVTEVVELHGGHPWRARLEGPFFEAARDALRDAFDVEPVLTGEGGSIPIVGEFERELGAPAILLGFALPGANMHAPDEWFPESHLELGIETIMNFLQRAGQR